MKKVIKLCLIMFALLTILVCIVGCRGQSERNNIGSSIDWGKGKYWDSNSESVQDNPFTD